MCILQSISNIITLIIQSKSLGIKYSEEQLKIINSSGNIRINAVAGSGKTTTVIAYAQANRDKGKILYIAYNKAVKLEAIRKFEKVGLTEVKIETAHSLAFKYVMRNNKYQLKTIGYTPFDIIIALKLQQTYDMVTAAIVSREVLKLTSIFCNSDKPKVNDLPIKTLVSQGAAESLLGDIIHYTRIFLSKMNSGELEITHDFYLKKFQLTQPKLDFDYILFDEGQDASPVMLDVFFRQNATKIIVGDTHQQIYGWRMAVNSLEKVDFPLFQLSKSFRFGKEIATIAKAIVSWKNLLNISSNIELTGNGISKKQETIAYIGRTNLGLLIQAISLISSNKVKRLYFEGNIHSYTYAEDGSSIYDILHLYNRHKKRVKNPIIKEMKSIEELEKYIENTEDVQLGMMLDLVKKYGNDLNTHINKLKDLHVEDDKKEQAQYIFTTVHKAKGMEYDVVHLVNDFITETRIEKSLRDNDVQVDINRLNEEINLLYVAITRAKTRIFIPQEILPKNFIDNFHIKSVESKTALKDNKPTTKKYRNLKVL